MDTNTITSADLQHTSGQNQITPLKWALYIFVGSLPLIGLIMLIVWGFGGDVNRTRGNWAKGMLILYAIFIAFYILIFIIFGLTMFSLNL